MPDEPDLGSRLGERLRRGSDLGVRHAEQGDLAAGGELGDVVSARQADLQACRLGSPPDRAAHATATDQEDRREARGVGGGDGHPFQFSARYQTAKVLFGGEPSAGPRPGWGRSRRLAHK